MSRFFAGVYDRIMAGEERRFLAAARAELVTTISGAVLEVGAGTGANVEYYPPDLQRLVLAEPDPHMRARLQSKFPATEVSSAALGALPFEDNSFDAVVCTLVLCSVDDTEGALADIKRVLRPGGQFLFMEHVCDTGTMHRVQSLCEPVWKRLAGGCHLTRQTESDIHSAGFRFEWIERNERALRMPIVRTLIRGVAVPSN